MYRALAYYRFVLIEDPDLEVERHKEFFKNRNMTGRIYLSKEGINGQMSGPKEEISAYIEWLQSDPRFKETSFKIHEIKENIFPRMTVKIRKQLVALDEEVDLAYTGEHVSPEKWKEMLESGEYYLLDVRNRYEWVIGHFEGANLPDLESFRDFPAYADKMSKTMDLEKTKVMMYCTGGIRCELYSALLKQKGFKKVYQLDGGVIHYGQKEGTSHWKGKLFVFDDRLAIPIDGENGEPIATCGHCRLPSDVYYNCANMDCNELFIACESCIENYQGCCSHGCKNAPRVRPFKREGGNKPFRRKHLIDRDYSSSDSEKSSSSITS